jgi:hypothetical protein
MNKKITRYTESFLNTKKQQEINTRHRTLGLQSLVVHVRVQIYDNYICGTITVPRFQAVE